MSETQGDRVEPLQPTMMRSRLYLLTGAHAVTHIQVSVLPLIYPSIMRAMGLGFVDVGVMLTVTRVVGGMLQGIWGTVSKSVSAKYILVMEQFGVAAGMAVTGTAQTYSELVGSVTLGQVASSPHHPIATGMISRWYDKKERGGALSFHVSGANVATVISPLIATLLLVHIGWRDTLYAFTVPAIVFGLVIAWKFPAAAVRQRTKRVGMPFGRAMVSPLRSPIVRRLIWTSGVTAGGKGLGILQTFVPLFLAKDLHLATVTTGVIFAAFTATSVLGPVLIGRWSDKRERAKFLSFVLVMSGLSAALVAGVVHMGLLVLVPSLLLLGIFSHSYSPIEQAMVADVTSQEIRDEAYSMFYGLSFTLSSMWPAALGLVVAHWGFTPMFLVVAGTYFTGAILYSLPGLPAGSRS